MRNLILAIFMGLPCVLACDKSANTVEPPDQKSGGGIDVDVPGVEVNVDPGEGVDVKTPAVDVEADRSDGTNVNVDPAEPK